MNAWPIFQLQDSASDLADPPHRVTLLAGSGGLIFPKPCPHCGHSACGRIVVQKVFRQASAGDSVTRYAVHRVEVPYCDDCRAQHQREQRMLT